MFTYVSIVILHQYLDFKVRIKNKATTFKETGAFFVFPSFVGSATKEIGSQWAGGKFMFMTILGKHTFFLFFFAYLYSPSPRPPLSRNWK